MALHQWNRIEKEQLNESLARQVVHGAQITLAKIYLRKGAIVPRHSHHNEQITTVQSGRLKFVFDDREQIVETNESLVIAAHEPHLVEALEESLALDVFSPVREDWRSGDDSYLRRPAPGAQSQD